MTSLAVRNALIAREAGFRVIPTMKGGKKPTRRFKDLPGATEEDIRRWRGNFAVCIGFDHLVIDADPRHFPEGDDVLRRLKTDYPELRRNDSTVLTPSGGVHMWYRAEKGGDESYSQKLPEYPGIEFRRGENTMVTLPGSMTEKGCYEMEDFSDMIPFADLRSAPMKLQSRLIRVRKVVGDMGLSGGFLRHRFESCLKLVHPDGEGLEIPENWNTLGYDLWCAILAAAKYHFGEEMRETMRRWSKQGKKYNAYDFDNTWDSFEGSDINRTAATLFVLADAQREKMKQVLSDYAIYKDSFIKLSTGESMTQGSFNHECAWFVPLNSDGKRTIPSTYYRGGFRVVGDVRFDPTKPVLFTRDRILTHNSFKRWMLTRTARKGLLRGDRYRNAIGVWMRHVEYICSREPESTRPELITYLQHWIAHLVRFPGVKMKTAPMLYGAKGSGKGRFADGVAAMIGNEYVSHAKPRDVLQGWGNYHEGKLLAVFHEFAIGYRDRVDVSNTIKELVTENRVSSNLKYGSNRMVDNFCNFCFCVNEISDLPIEANERRYIAINLPPIENIRETFGMEPDAYFQELSKVIEEDCELIKGWYVHVFNFDEEVGKRLMYRAPETEAYREMNEEILRSSDDNGLLEEILTEWRSLGEEAKDICCTVLAIQVYRDSKGSANAKCSSSRFSKFLRNSMDYEPVPGRVSLHGRQYRFVATKGVDVEQSLAALRDNPKLRRILLPEDDNVDEWS